MRSNWCIGMTERPSTTDISTLTLSRLEDIELPMEFDAAESHAIMVSGPLTPEWRVRTGLLDYPEAVAFMEARAAAIAAHEANELVWLIEHPPIYTAGTSAKDADLVDARFPVHRTGRGGQFTYHGPGQRVGYVMLG